jgi:chromosome segregation ATPase
MENPATTARARYLDAQDLGELAETKQRLEWATRDMHMLEADLAAANERANFAEAYFEGAQGKVEYLAEQLGLARQRAERAEADLAAARQQLDQVRELAEEFSRISTKYGNEHGGYPEANAYNDAKRDAYDYASDRLLAILDAPARPADETP